MGNFAVGREAYPGARCGTQSHVDKPVHFMRLESGALGVD